jgi:O-methyltransferase
VIVMLDVRFQIKKIARSALAPLLYRYPPFTLAPERLYLFMHYLIETQDVPGAVVEIGCNLGGTAIIARKMLRRLGMDKPYVCNASPSASRPPCRRWCRRSDAANGW